MNKKIILALFVGFTFAGINTSFAQSWNQAQASTQEQAQGCNPQVANNIQQSKAQAIQSETQLGTLYNNLINMTQYSCLGNIFNQGASIFFSPPNWQQIISQLENAACSKVNSYVQQAEQPVLSALQQGAQGAIPLNSIAPGLNLSGVNFGVSVQSNGTNQFNTNFSQALQQFNGQSVGSPFSTTNSTINNNQNMLGGLY